jgi:hypothetical protein
VKSASLAIAICLAVLSGCGASRSAAPADDRLSVDRLYPLRLGAVWSYDVDTGEGLPILAITRVTALTEQRAEIAVGREPIVYERRVEGLFRPDRAAYVLLAPVRAGEQWEAGSGATAEVRSVDKSVTTPAGEFHGCAEIVETGAAGGKTTRTVFCPDVGPVEVESSMPLPESDEIATVTARLRGYDLSGQASQ